MPLRFRETSLFTRKHSPILLLLYNSFFWFFAGKSVVAKLAGAFPEYLGLYLEAAFPLSILLSALIGSIFISKARESKILRTWLLFGTMASFLPVIPVSYSFASTIVIIIILGISFGIGMPSLLRYFSESFPIENRGVVGGSTFFLATISAPIFLIATSGSLGNLVPSVLFLVAWRCWSIPMATEYFMANRLKYKGTCQEKQISLLSVFRNRIFALYFLAWLMFSMVDGFAPLAVEDSIGDFEFGMMSLIEPIVAGVSALITGVLADRAGRKRMIIFGFVSLGIAYAVLGTASDIPISWYIYFVVDGFALGSLWTMFTIVIWGEAAKHGIEKYYAVGEAPYFLTQALHLLLGPTNLGLLSFPSVFSLASFFLFIGVVPLLYAPETLPQSKIEQRQLRIYTKEALKMTQRAEQKQK